MAPEKRFISKNYKLLKDITNVGNSFDQDDNKEIKKNIYIYIYINTKKIKKCQENYCIGKVFFKIEMRWLIGL